MRVIVKFLAPRQPFNAGEVAGFSPERAAELCDAMKVAKRIDYIPETEEDKAVVKRMQEKLRQKQEATGNAGEPANDPPADPPADPTDPAPGQPASEDPPADPPAGNEGDASATETSGKTGKKTPRRGQKG